MKVTARLSPLVFIMLLGGCNLPIQSGNYNGNLSLVRFTHLEEAHNTPVRVSVRAESKSKYSAHIFPLKLIQDGTQEDESSELLHPIEITGLSKTSLFVSIPDVRKEDFVLARPDSSQPCFRSKPEEAELDRREGFRVEFCYDSEQFTLRVEENDQEHLTLSGTRFEIEAPIVFEEPVSLTLQEAVHSALKSNFNVQQAQRTLYRINQRAQSAYYDLFPHFSGKFVLGGGPLRIGGFLPELSSLVPFVFPNRWLASGARSLEAKAEKFANTLLQINTATSIQTLSIAYDAQVEIRDELKSLHTDIFALLASLKENQDSFGRQIEPNSTLTIEILINDLDISLYASENEISSNQISLSGLLGFQNPMAVEKVILGKETTRVSSIPILEGEVLEAEKKRLAEISICNSFELQQLRYLHKAAQLDEKSVYFNWFDFTSSLNMGLGLFPQARIAHSLIETLDLRIAETRQALIARAYSQIRERNLIRKNLEIYEASLVSRRDRLSQLMSKYNEWIRTIESGKESPVKSSDIRNAVKDLILGLRSYYSARAAVEINQVELDRLELQGAYLYLLPG